MPRTDLLKMGDVKLELRCPKSINGIVVDPEPDWSLDSLLSELNSLELKLNASSMAPGTFTKTRLREFPSKKSIGRSPKAFVMCISDDEIDDIESEGEEVHDRSLVVGKRFTCPELYMSESEDESALEETQTHLIGKVGLVENLLIELNHEHELGVKDEIRNQIFTLETEMINENERSVSALVQVERCTEARLEMDRKQDAQYQRKIAEALDNHLTAVLRDHEHRSQIEERKIRNDAAFEEAKRKEKALQEEKPRQEKAKAEAEARLEAAKKRAEEAKKAAMEAERRAAKEAAERETIETTKMMSPEVARKEATGHQGDVKVEGLNAQSKGSRFGPNRVQSAGNILKSAESALKVEEGRLRKFKELDEKNQTLRLSTNKDFHSYELQIARRIKQIAGTKEIVRSKANELIKIINDPICPQSISIALFAKKVVSLCENPSASFGNTAFACGHVIVLVTSQVPLAMDLVLAEFHRACIYTVPKHINYSESAFGTTEAYYKMIGYREEDGKIESTERYLKRLESYMILYGALVQTEVDGIQNTHGLKEGWAWFARFLNALPANKYTAVALEAFLKMAGFALFKKYKSQFRKILNIISHNFLDALEAREDPKLNRVITKIKSYIETNRFQEEPEGWRLRTSLLSDVCAPESDPGFYQEQSHYQSNRYLSQY